MKLWEILVPAANTLQHHQAWDREVMRIAGGLTIMRKVQGRWATDAADHVAEQMIPVRIACTRDKMDEILEFTMQHYNQYEVMAYVVSDQVVFRDRFGPK